LSSQPLVSVVIPTYKRPHDLTRLLMSIKNGTYPLEKIEIIVVDNASDLDEEVVKKHFPKATIITPGANLWSNGARRVGTEAAHGEYIFHIDDDNEVDPECIAQLVRGLEEDESLGITGPLMFHDDTDVILSLGAKITKYGLIIYVEGGKKMNQVSLPPKVEGFDYLHNAIMIRRSVLEQVAFDDGNFPHNWAESDFGLRVGAKGFKMACITTAKERHHGGYISHLTRVGPDKTYDQAISRILFRKRHMASLGDWLRFWIINFPASTALYLWQILKTSNSKKSTLSAYIRGTLDGIRKPLKELPEAKLAPKWDSA
jgi:GT2 family glycosyltransferase